MTELTQTQLDRYNAFESMLDMMSDNDTAYTKAEITATIDQLVEMAIEDREEEKPERFLDRYPVRTQDMTNRALLVEIERLEMKAAGQLMEGQMPDRFDQMRHDFVKAELNQRRSYEQI